MQRMLKTLVACLVLVMSVGPLVAAETKPAGKEPAIGGYCPVAYVKAHKAIKGDARYSSEQEGLVYLFSSREAKKMFDADPGQYRVAYHGWCATGVAMGKKITSDPQLFTVHKGVTYLFSSAEAKAAFDKSPDMTIAKAEENWPKLN